MAENVSWWGHSVVQAHPKLLSFRQERLENRYRAFPAIALHWDEVADSMFELDGTCRIVSMASEQLSPAEAW